MEENNNMTIAEMQKFLDEEALEGKTEIEAYRKLARILGIHYTPPEREKEKDSPAPTTA